MTVGPMSLMPRVSTNSAAKGEEGEDEIIPTRRH